MFFCKTISKAVVTKSHCKRLCPISVSSENYLKLNNNNLPSLSSATHYLKIRIIAEWTECPDYTFIFTLRKKGNNIIFIICLYFVLNFSGCNSPWNPILVSCGNSKTGESWNSTCFCIESLCYHGENSKVRRRCKNII